MKYLTRVKSGINTYQKPQKVSPPQQNGNAFAPPQNKNTYPQQLGIQIDQNMANQLQYQEQMIQQMGLMGNVQGMNHGQVMNQQQAMSHRQDLHVPQSHNHAQGMNHIQRLPPGYIPNMQNVAYITDPGYMIPASQQMMTEQQLIEEHQMALQMAQMQVQVGQHNYPPNVGQQTPANFPGQMINMQVPAYQEKHLDLPPHLIKEPHNYPSVDNKPMTNPNRINHNDHQPAHFQSQKRRKNKAETQKSKDRPNHNTNSFIHHSEPQNMITPAMQASLNAANQKEDIIKSIKSYQQLHQENSNSRKNSKVQNVFYDESKQGSYKNIPEQKREVAPQIPVNQMSFSNINSVKMSQTANLEFMGKKKSKLGKKGERVLRVHKKTKRDSIKKSKFVMNKGKKKKVERNLKKKRKEFGHGDKSYKVK